MGGPDGDEMVACGLPRGVEKFLFNSVLASLQTKDNVHKWAYGLYFRCVI